jgi:hypothetical protein
LRFPYEREEKKGIETACPLLKLSQEIFDLVASYLGKKDQYALAKTMFSLFVSLLRNTCGFGITQHLYESTKWLTSMQQGFKQAAHMIVVFDNMIRNTGIQKDQYQKGIS